MARWFHERSNPTSSVRANAAVSLVEQMKVKAAAITTATEELHGLLENFTEYDGFAQVTADDGTEFADVPDFLTRELGLSAEFQQFLIDDDE